MRKPSARCSLCLIRSSPRSLWIFQEHKTNVIENDWRHSSCRGVERISRITLMPTLRSPNARRKRIAITSILNITPYSIAPSPMREVLYGSVKAEKSASAYVGGLLWLCCGLWQVVLQQVPQLYGAARLGWRAKRFKR